METQIDTYGKIEIQPFVEQLLNTHYTSIESLCAEARKQTERVGRLEMQYTISQYAFLCNAIIIEAAEHINSRREKYIPYVLQLSEKAATNHDCTGCTGSCKLNHDMHLLELKASNTEMQNMLNKLQIASLPLYSETLYPDEYRVLRTQMALIENSLTELFFLENNYLVPKIVEAQKRINAGNH